MNDIDVLMEFLRFPLDNSDELFHKFSDIPGCIQRGENMEKFIFIKGKRENKVLLVAHADTYWDSHYGKGISQPQEFIQTDGIIQNKNGGLGADDRAGCAMLWLLRHLGHSLLITNGEEHGRIGSKWLMQNNQDIADEINQHHQFLIQLDRRNKTDFKCYTVGTDEFREYVSEMTGYTEPNYSSYTDIVTLCRDVCGVNLSIGYHNEHTANEFLDMSAWQNTLRICRKWLSKDDLPRFALP